MDSREYLFENIQESAKSKRVALWMTNEIIKAKNRDDSIMLAVASLGLPRDALNLVKLYSKKAGEYSLSSLTIPEQVEDMNAYFLTSKKGLYLNQELLEDLGFDADEAQAAVKNVLAENVIPVWMELLILQQISSERSDIKIISTAKGYETGFPVDSNTEVVYREFSRKANHKVVSSARGFSQSIIKERRVYQTYSQKSRAPVVSSVKSFSQSFIQSIN